MRHTKDYIEWYIKDIEKKIKKESKEKYNANFVWYLEGKKEAYKEILEMINEN